MASTFTQQLIGRRQRALSGRIVPDQRIGTVPGTLNVANFAQQLRQKRRQDALGQIGDLSPGVAQSGPIASGASQRAGIRATAASEATAEAESAAAAAASSRMADEQAQRLMQERQRQDEDYQTRIAAQQAAYDQRLKDQQDIYDKQAQDLKDIYDKGVKDLTPPPPKDLSFDEKMAERYGQDKWDFYGGWVKQAYQKWLGRDPDPGGWQMWTDALVSGYHWNDIAQAMLGSDESLKQRTRADAISLWHNAKSNWFRTRDPNAWFIAAVPGVPNTIPGENSPDSDAPGRRNTRDAGDYGFGYA